MAVTAGNIGGTPTSASPCHGGTHARATDWLELRLRLRPELIFRPQKIAGRSVYIVEDPLRTQFYRLGRDEYLLAASLDGQLTLRAAIGRANRARPQEPLTEQDALSILNWANQNDLLETMAESQPSQSTDPIATRHARPKGWQNPVCFRLPLGSPDPLIARCYPYLAWIYSRWATAVGLSLIVAGLATLVDGWDRMVLTKDAIFSPSGQLSLVVCWILLKAIHEFSHGLVCRRYGGAVREAGLVFILFLPIAYVDVTAAWRIRSRWQRIHIAAAGMQLELYVAGLAAIVWSLTSPGIFNQLCGNLVLMAGVTTILFNANPLMRFDGYYLLTDLLQMPNLAVSGQSWLGGWARRFFLGLPTAGASHLKRVTPIVRMYAVAAFGWRVFVCLGMIVAASAMWHGAGIVLAGIAVVTWIGIPLAKLIQLRNVKSGPAMPNWRRFATVVAVIGLVSACLLTYLPWPGGRKVAGLVDYDPPTALRTEVDGFVKQVVVGSGEYVTAGQEVARLQNDELQRDFAILQTQLEVSRLHIRGLRGRRELAEMEAETEQLAALEKQRAELSRRVAGLVLRAPVAGRVVSRNLDAKVGLFLHQGEALLSLGSEDRKRIDFSIPQDKLADFETASHSLASVSLAGGTSLNCQVERVEPRATVHPFDRSVCAPFGGELLVRQATTDVKIQNHEASLELLQPHFTGNILLNAEQSVQLKSGQRAQVLLGGQRESIGAHLWELLAIRTHPYGWNTCSDSKRP